MGSIPLGGKGGGGNGGHVISGNGQDGKPNTGGGGGGANNLLGGKGGSGIIIIRYLLPTRFKLSLMNNSYSFQNQNLLYFSQSNNKWNVFTIRSSFNDLTIWINNTKVNFSNQNTRSFINSFIIGKNLINNTLFFNGNIAEILIFKDFLSNDNINKVNQYLFLKWFGLNHIGTSWKKLPNSFFHLLLLSFLYYF